MERLRLGEELDVPVRPGGPKKYFKELFTFTDRAAGKNYVVLDVAPVTKQEIYLAVEERDFAQTAENGIEGRRVFARLCLPLPEGAGSAATLKYRIEDETYPPTLTNCPLRILNLLTPTEDINALQWRLACYEKQVEDARRAFADTKVKYEATHFDNFRDYVRKSAEMMVERRFLILHQAMSAEQITRALLARLRIG